MAFDRRQKSFGEPTRVRTDGRASEGGGNDDVPRPKPASTAYERYKQELQSFFNGQRPLPDHLKDLLATRPGAAEHGLAAEEPEPSAAPAPGNGAKGKKAPARAEERKRRVAAGPTDEVAELVAQLGRATSPRDVESVVNQLRERGVALPRDPEILSKALGHGNEEVIAEALRGLIEIDLPRIKSPGLLKTRIKNVLLLASTSEVRELGQQLLARL
ncbi:MAG: hypothetical protein IT383_23665 [Deltaproteobacteria bacterium]|nr:hypothetical protein [Deltaproteobacteria bacterium]